MREAAMHHILRKLKHHIVSLNKVMKGCKAQASQ